MVGVTVPIITYGHEFLVTEAFEPALAPLPTLRDPDRLIYFRTEVGGLDHGRLRAQPGAVGARRRARRVRGPAPARGLAAVRAAARGGGRAGAGDGDGRGAQALQRPRGVHARRRVHPRRVRRARVLGRGRVLRPRPGRRRRHGLADGRVDRRTASRASTCGTWTAAASAASTAAATTRSRGRPRSTRPTTTSSTPTTSAPPGRPLRLSPAYARLAELGAELRREVGLGAGQLVRAERGARATRRLRPRGWAGQNWSPAIHAEAMATRERAGALRRDVVRQDRGHGAGRRRLPAAAVRQRRRPRRSGRSPTPRC